MEENKLKNLTKTLLRQLLSGEDGGFIRIPRRLMEGLFSADSEENRLHRVYVALISQASYADTMISYRRHKFYVREGELITSFRKIAAIVGINYVEVSRIINRLQEEGLIKKYNLGGGQLISVQHYRAITRGVFKPTNKSASTTSASTALPETDDPGVLQRLREEFRGKM